MANRVFEQLTVEQINIFRHSFSSISRATFYDEETGRLIHAYEFGTYREAICRDFLKFFIPGRLDIAQGFLINAENKVSSQCDIIVYDSNSTPLIQSESRQRFFPVETVCAVGEVKSRVSKDELRGALKRLSFAKQMREDIDQPLVIWQKKPHPFDPETYLDDQLFTFVICEKLDFSLSSGSIEKLYEDGLPHRHKHNMILSIEDGLLLYYYEPDRYYSQWPVVYPNNTVVELNHHALIPTSGHELIHFKGFATNMFLAMSSATVLFPDAVLYLGLRPGGPGMGGSGREV
jgi:hypothetical protein